MRNILLTLTALSTLVSCTKVIELDLNDAGDKIVVDGVVSNDTANNFIKLQSSAGFYDDNTFDPITGATVTITDQNGMSYPMTESTPGIYTNPAFVGQAYTTYDLSIDANGELITATTYLPGNTPIDSIVTLEAPGGFFGEGYTAFLYWTDEVSERNYYRIRTYENTLKENIIYISEDNLYNGIGTGQPLFTNSYEFGDSATIELMEIDAGTYEYWFSLSQISDPQNQPAAPGNPETNLQGNALGYFGAYNITRESKIVQ